MREVFQTTDAGLAEAILSRSYGKLRIDPHGRPVMIRLARAPLGPSARLDRASFAMSFSTRGDPLDALHINHLRSGQVRYDPDGSERSYGPGDIFLAVQPGHPYTTQSHDADIEVTVIDPALLSQVAGTGPGGAGQPVRLTGYDPVSAQTAGQWKTTLAYVRDTVLASPDAAAMPLLASGAARLLAATALAVFPSNVFTDPTSTDRHDAHRGTVRRAVAFIDEHACTDITIADIAAAAFVTIRAVQLAFRRHLDTTPTAYVRRVRLEHAHRQLRAADPATTTVTDVACRWGFSNATRFAAYYRQAYGVPPATPSARIHNHPHDPVPECHVTATSRTAAGDSKRNSNEGLDGLGRYDDRVASTALSGGVIARDLPCPGSKRCGSLAPGVEVHRPARVRRGQVIPARADLVQPLRDLRPQDCGLAGDRAGQGQHVGRLPQGALDIAGHRCGLVTLLMTRWRRCHGQRPARPGRPARPTRISRQLLGNATGIARTGPAGSPTKVTVLPPAS